MIKKTLKKFLDIDKLEQRQQCKTTLTKKMYCGTCDEETYTRIEDGVYTCLICGE